MDFFQPTSLAEALETKAANPGARWLAGGTDLMVELNFDKSRPEGIVDLTRVEELEQWSRDNGHVMFGAGVSYTRLIAELFSPLPGLAIAARTVGSPQIRNRGTVGGNLGTSSPAGDAIPPLLASGTEVIIASARGERTVKLEDFFTGVKKNLLDSDELVVSVRASAARGPQQFSKIGTRNAMVISVATFAVALDVEARMVGTGVGSAGPVCFRAREAERFIAAALQEAGIWDSRAGLAGSDLDRFGELVADAASPIDDVRGTAAYRRHALRVMARRTLSWVWDAHRRSG